MEKTLFKTKRGAFKIQWHSNVLLVGCFNDDHEFVIVLLQLVFIFNKPLKNKKH
jgi:hypothetical protein